MGGENVAALEIASHLQAHPCVSVAQVVGVADEKYGEVPAAFKVPRYVRFVTEWPMSSTKVQTFRLREQLEAELTALISDCEPTTQP